MHFNRPPNWPLPDDFTPGADWRPFPEWGAPPVGWALWIDNDGKPIGAAAAPLLTPRPGDEFYGNPAGTLATPDQPSAIRVMMAVTLALAAIGLFMSLQSVSLLTGTGTLYTGLALVVGARVLAWVMKLPNWVRITTWMVAIFCVVNLFYVEHQLSQRRHEIQQIVTNIQQPPPCSTTPVLGCDATQ